MISFSAEICKEKEERSIAGKKKQNKTFSTIIIIFKAS